MPLLTSDTTQSLEYLFWVAKDNNWMDRWVKKNEQGEDQVGGIELIRQESVQAHVIWCFVLLLRDIDPKTRKGDEPKANQTTKKKKKETTGVVKCQARYPHSCVA